MKRDNVDSVFFPASIALLCGLYPFLFYLSNNYSAINSWQHILYFIIIFLGLPFLFICLGYSVLVKFKRLKTYRFHFLFLFTVNLTVALMSQAMFLTIKKKILLVFIIVSIVTVSFMSKQLMKLRIILIILCVCTLPKLAIVVYDHLKPKYWTILPDEIEDVQFKLKPNIYFIQTDGYVNESTLIGDTYKHSNDLYKWLRNNKFKTYDGFRSNYPASLASNAATFGMKHHYFGNTISPNLEVANARSIISGNNPVIKILKANDYSCHFIVQDEYFQQNMSQDNYDSYNIKLAEIPFFSNDNNIKKNVFKDLEKQMKITSNKPQFYFVEKLLPHHIHFNSQENQVEKEREWYAKRIDSVNFWIKKTVRHIKYNDPKSLIVLQADHGGWVGLKNYKEMYTTHNKDLINSIFSSMLAISWDEINKEKYDNELKSSVNLFRVLFSALSENNRWLKRLEDNSSYNINLKWFNKSVKKVINNKGEIVID
jgi:hypothetical protein